MRAKTFYAGVNRTRRKSIKGIIEDIKRAMASEIKDSPGWLQYQAALEYWESRSKS